MFENNVLKLFLNYLIYKFWKYISNQTYIKDVYNSLIPLFYTLVLPPNP